MVASSFTFLPFRTSLILTFFTSNHSIRGPVKEEDLRLCRGRHASRNRDGFRDRDIGPQFILARLSYLAGDGKKGLLKVFEIDVDNGVVKSPRVRLF